MSCSWPERRPHGRPLDRVRAIIPCLDEEAAIGPCVAAVLAHGVGEVIVVDGGSTDRTVARASDGRRPRHHRAAPRLRPGAAVGHRSTLAERHDRPVHRRRRQRSAGDDPGRARADRARRAPISCWARACAARASPAAWRRPRSSPGHLAGLLICLRYGVRFTDMSPFRAIRRDALERLGMREETFGWNLEMQMRAAAAGCASWRCRSVSAGAPAASPRCRAICATAVRVAWVLLATFLRLSLRIERNALSSKG